ncbi:hypothetical protein BH23BAC3_BH23BAC3_16120 [soil metagenome]
MLGTDTAKRDLILVVIGLLAAGFFYWFYSSIHPLSSADSSLGKESAAQQISEHLNRLGYISSPDNYLSFRVDSDILNLMQTNKENGHQHAADSSGKPVPAFYWHGDQKIIIDERSATLMASEPGDDRIEIRLSESGDLLSLSNPSAVFPSRVIVDNFFEEMYPSIVPALQQLRTDNQIFDKFRFQLNESNSNNRQFGESGLYHLTEEDARLLARYHLEQTGWPANFFNTGTIETVVYHGVDAVRVQLTGGGYAKTELHLEILPTGALLNLEYQFSDTAVADETWSDIRFGAISISILFFAIWVLVLLFIRIRLRLIDTKLSVLIAVLAGFLLPVLFLFEWIYDLLYTFDEFVIRESFGRLFGLGFLAAIGSLFYFTTTAVGDSITRDNWSEKLRTFDFLRIGKIFNRPVGLVFLRAVVYSYILVALFGLLFYLIPDSYMNISEEFRSDRTLFPSLSVLILSGLIFLITVQSILLITIGKLRSYTHQGIWVILLTALIFTLIGILPIHVEPWSTDFIIAGLLGLVIGWIYLKEDFLTIFICLFLVGIHLMSASGWVMDYSPDRSIFYVSIIFILSLIGFGLFGLYKGEPIDQLPEYVPDYINELKKDERIKQELQIARIVQKSFLPGKMPVGKGIDFAAICKPAYETGGDYYDFIKINDDQLAVTIGDVSGKGIEAAFYMTFTKGVLHALCSETNSTVEILSKINSLFRKNARKGTFISLVFGIIDYKNNTFRFSRGGHNPILHFSAENGTVKEYTPPGIALGMAGDELFRQHISESVINLKKGDLIVLFTDGVVEATNGRGDFYGDTRLNSIIKRNSRLSADKILKAVTKDLYEFGEGSDLHDDMTAIVIKKR